MQRVSVADGNPFFALDDPPPPLAQGCPCGAHDGTSACACGALLCRRCLREHGEGLLPCPVVTEEAARVRRGAPALGDDGGGYEERRRLDGRRPCEER